MAVSYAKNKKHIMKWRANNRTEYNEYCRKAMRKYDEWKRIAKIFRNILIDEIYI